MHYKTCWFSFKWAFVLKIREVLPVRLEGRFSNVAFYSEGPGGSELKRDTVHHPNCIFPTFFLHYPEKNTVYCCATGT